MNILTSHPDRSTGRIASVGMYDGVHLGHLSLIEFLKRQGEERGLRSAGVTFRSHPLSLIAPDRVPPMLSSLDEKLALLERAGLDDCILLEFDEHLRSLPAAEFMALLRRNFGVESLVTGFNHRMGHDRLQGVELLGAAGRQAGVEIIPAPEFRLSADGCDNGLKVSSSAIRQLLAEGRVEDANRALGYPYTLKGTVVGGNRIGRTLGFPTANLSPTNPSALIPSDGVYAAEALLTPGAATGMPAVVNIGKRPTVTHDFHGTQPSVIEAHILDFNGNIYGSPMALRFISRLRDERRFANIDALRTQLAADIETARAILTR